MALLAAAFSLFLTMTVAGLAGVDRLLLPGFLGVCITLGLWVWTSGREQDSAIRSMRVDDRRREDRAA